MSATFVFAKSAPSAEYDRPLAWAALLLAATGLVMVYSASIATAESARYTGHNAAWYLARHGLVLGVALSAAIMVFLVPAKWWQHAAPWLFMFGVALLVLVLIPGLRPRGERRAPLARPAGVQPAALGAGEARRGALRRRLHRAQARGDEELQARACCRCSR